MATSISRRVKRRQTLKSSGCIEENIPESKNAGSAQPLSDSLISAAIDTPQADALGADDCNDHTPVLKRVSEVKFEKDTPTTVGATTRLLIKNMKRPKCVFAKPVKNNMLSIRARNRIERAQRKRGLRKLAKLCKGNEARPPILATDIDTLLSAKFSYNSLASQFKKFDFPVFEVEGNADIVLVGADDKRQLNDLAKVLPYDKVMNALSMCATACTDIPVSCIVLGGIWSSNQWLTTTAILTSLKALAKNYSNVGVVSPSFIETQEPGRKRIVANAYKAFSSQNKNIIGILNFGNAHWVAYHIDVTNKTCRMFDPLQSNNNYERLTANIKEVVEPLLSVIGDLSYYTYASCVQQDGDNCGLWSIVVLELTLADKLWDNGFAAVAATTTATRGVHTVDNSSRDPNPALDDCHEIMMVRASVDTTKNSVVFKSFDSMYDNLMSFSPQFMCLLESPHNDDLHYGGVSVVTSEKRGNITSTVTDFAKQTIATKAAVAGTL
ncbi:unnamed protein product [Phytophthora fragariaefolia]|uniref:Unnamed protein product n=1 Tax=Phytophthora fragariaefolia TaxID=1490495 RepID=A0A9W6XR48_9STRA|nr:unnamed protein product [Phytophthora fragariaefolia]